MSYRRFNLQAALTGHVPTPATVATDATVPSTIRENVASVARVAAPHSVRSDATELQRTTGPECEEDCSRDWHAYFEERAAVREHDGGLPRTDAERLAYEDVTCRWLYSNPPAAS